MNKVKSIRTRLGLTQRQLADMVGTSQQQIQRIESGKIAARLGLATQIAVALGKSLNAVFPGSEQAILKVREGAGGRQSLLEEGGLNRVHSTGIELDPSDHFFKIWVRGHARPIVFTITAREKRRLFDAVQGERDDTESLSFIVFDSADKRVAINLAELATCQFLFNPCGGFGEEDEDGGAAALDSASALVFHAGSETPLTFGPEPDDVDPEEGPTGYFNEIFFNLELSPSASERVHFEDEDGESVFIRVGSLALLSVPLWVVDPDELAVRIDQAAEDETGEGRHDPA